MDPISATLVLGLSVFLYTLPARLALNRRHARARDIRRLNLALGWTLLGWGVALAWALKRRKSAGADQQAQAALDLANLPNEPLERIYGRRPKIEVLEALQVRPRH